MSLAPEPGQLQRQEAENASISFELAGKRYTIRPGEVPATLAREFRKEVGMSFRAAMVMLNDDMDIDVLQALVWLARRQDGEKVTLDDIDDFDYVAMRSFKPVEDEAEQDEDSPEHSAGN